MTGADFIDRLGKTVLLHQPGSNWEYGFSTDVLGRVVEVVSGKTLGQFLDERIFRPLGMPDTGFAWVQLINTGDWRRASPRIPTRGSPSPSPTQRRRPNSSAAAVARCPDPATTSALPRCWPVAAGWTACGCSARKTVEYMTSDHLGPAIGPGTDYIPGAGYGFGLGFAVRRAAGVAGVAQRLRRRLQLGRRLRDLLLGENPEDNLVVVSMTQAPGPIRVYYRHMIKSLVLQAIAD